ncbi:MAG TPA: GTP cyclohydrolase I FolE [Kofleriaceae bacterium]|nr:GTP cyclohydrolase I FolE [Kofleriaceae bacterium]
MPVPPVTAFAELADDGEDGDDGERPPATRPPFDHARAERAVRELLLAMGEDPAREGLRDTPARVARAFAELTGGLHDDPARHLARVFGEGTDDLVVVRDIELWSLCEHHLLPFTGRAHIAYRPSHGKVVGLSKLARTVEVLARRPQVQERLTREIADAVERHLDAAAVGVQLESEHLCMQARGVRQRAATMTTLAWRGLWRSENQQRAEVAALLRGGR